MQSPVYFILLIVVGALCFAGLVALFIVGALLLWQTWALVRINRMVAEALGALAGPLQVMGPLLANAGKVCTELKEFQDGEVRLMHDQVKATKDLVFTVEQFQAMLIPPGDETIRPRRGAGVQIASEQDEMQREARRAERAGLSGVNLEEVGKNVGTV